MCFYDNWGIEAQYWVLMAITVGKCMVCKYWSNVFYVQGGYLSKKIFFSGWLSFRRIFFSGWLYRLHIAWSACFCKGGFCEGKNSIPICDCHFCNDEFSISVNTVSNILLFELSPLLLSRLKAWALGSPISPFSMLRTSKVTVMMMVLGVVAIMMVMVAMMMVMTMIMIMTTKKLRMIIVIFFLISMLCASKAIAMATGSQKKVANRMLLEPKNPNPNWMLLGQMFPWTLLGSA